MNVFMADSLDDFGYIFTIIGNSYEIDLYPHAKALYRNFLCENLPWFNVLRELLSNKDIFGEVS